MLIDAKTHRSKTQTRRHENNKGSLAFVDARAGGLAKRGAVELTLDGYSAPVSAGNFAVNVLDGLYDGR